MAIIFLSFNLAKIVSSIVLFVLGFLILTNKTYQEPLEKKDFLGQTVRNQTIIIGITLIVISIILFIQSKEYF